MELLDNEIKYNEDVFITENQYSSNDKNTKEKNLQLNELLKNNIQQKKKNFNLQKLQKNKNKLNIKFNFQKVTLNLPLNTLPNQTKEKPYLSILTKIKHINKSEFNENENIKKEHSIKKIFQPIINSNQINQNNKNKKLKVYVESPTEKIYNPKNKNDIYSRNNFKMINFKSNSKKNYEKSLSPYLFKKLENKNNNQNKNKILKKLLKEEMNIKNNNTIYFNYEKIKKNHSIKKKVDTNNKKNIFNFIDIKDFGKDKKIFNNINFNSTQVSKFSPQHFIYKRKIQSKDNTNENIEYNKNIFPIINNNKTIENI